MYVKDQEVNVRDWVMSENLVIIKIVENPKEMCDCKKIYEHIFGDFKGSTFLACLQQAYGLVFGKDREVPG